MRGNPEKSQRSLVSLYQEGHPRLKEREKRRRKHGHLTGAQHRLRGSGRCLRHRGSGSRAGSDELDALWTSLPQRSGSRHLGKGKELDHPHQDGRSHHTSLDSWRRRVIARKGLMPSVETISVKRGGASYQVPIPIHWQRRVSLASRWLIEGAEERKKKESLRSFSEARRVESLYVLRDRSRMAASSGSGGSGGLGASGKEKDKEGQGKGEGMPGMDSRGSSQDLERKSYGVPKKLARHRVAKTNRVFAHRRWR